MITRYHRWLSLFATAAVLTGCPPSSLKPSIVVNNSLDGSSGALSISGQGFDPTVSPCAALSIQGLPWPSSSLAIGKAQCNNGSFAYNWPYTFNGCALNQQVSATVFAVDTQGTNAGASQPVSFAWGKGCALPGTCGNEGQPVCAGNTCTGDLHPDFQGGIIVCASDCGHAQGTISQVPQRPCVIPRVPPDLTQGGIYSCYDNGMIDTFGNCLCVPNTLNQCPVSTSIPAPPQANSGLCIQGQFKDLNGNGC